MQQNCALFRFSNWAPVALFFVVLFTGVFFLNVNTPNHLQILMCASSVSVLARLQILHRERIVRKINELNRLAYYDELTGLFNRRKIIELLENALNNNSQKWVLLIDLDGFKRVNDQYGHLAGDEILRQTAERLRLTLNRSAHIARLGGDEFLIIADRSGGLNELIADIRRVVARPYQVDGVTVTIGASIGTATLRNTGLRNTNAATADLLRAADEKMYLDKSLRKIAQTGSSNMFSDPLSASLKRQLFQFSDNNNYCAVV